MRKLGIKEIEELKGTTFIIEKSRIEGPINPERYKALWLEDLFKGQKIKNVAEILDSKINPSKYFPDETFDVIRIDDLPNNPLEVSLIRTLTGKELEGSFFEVQENDILFARLGPTIQNRKVVLSPKTQNRTLASPEFLVLRTKKGIEPLTILSVLRTKKYRDLVYSKGRGSTPSRYRVIREDFLKLPFPNIDSFGKELANELEDRITKVKNLVKEAQKLWD